MSDDVRMTVRMPAAAAQYLDREARENFTSRNAEVVRAIRTAMKMTKGPAGTAIPPGRGLSTPNEENADEQGNT